MSHERPKVPEECVFLTLPRAVVHLEEQLDVGIVIPVVREKAGESPVGGRADPIATYKQLRHEGE